MLILSIILVILLLYSSIKCFIYYCTVRGLLYYLGMEHDDLIDAKKAKELTLMAARRIKKEFFGRS